MSRAEDFLFRMVLVAHHGNEYGKDAADSDWIVNASLQKLRSGKFRAVLSAENVNTGLVLTYPKDYDKIVDVLPEEYWPDFIKTLNPGVPDEQEPALLAGRHDNG